MSGIEIQELTELFVIFIIILIIFLLLREFWCWYWKQNKIISLLTDIRALLESQNKTRIGEGILNNSLSDQMASTNDTRWQKP